MEVEFHNLYNLSLLNVKFLTIALSVKVFWNNFGKLSENINEKLHWSLANVQSLIKFLIICEMLHCLWWLTWRVSHDTKTLLIRNKNFIKNLFSFGCESTLVNYPGYVAYVFFYFTWLTNTHSLILDKANLFLGGGQKLLFANLVSACSSNESL